MSGCWGGGNGGGAGGSRRAFGMDIGDAGEREGKGGERRSDAEPARW